MPSPLMDNRQLVELAERCEKATGPDRELDLDIGLAALGWRVFGAANGVGIRDSFTPLPDCVPSPTASLDAAKMLAPEGLTILVEQLHEGWRTSLWSDDVTPVSDVVAATEELSRCAAALRARASQEPRSQKGEG